MQHLNQGEVTLNFLPDEPQVSSSGLSENQKVKTIAEQEDFDFLKEKIVQQPSGSSSTVLCINVDHFNLFFLYSGKLPHLSFLN